MPSLKRADLYSLEQYAELRAEFRKKVLAHKRYRQIALGPNLTLYFEDRLTVQYQIQEMLRTERIFEAAGIQDELDTYNPMIPDGQNLKATMMLEYSDEQERKIALAELIGVENQIWIQLGDQPKIYAIADEDLERTHADKTSAVHFLRFQLEPKSIEAFKAHQQLTFGCDHLHMLQQIAVDVESTYQTLLADLDS